MKLESQKDKSIDLVSEELEFLKQSEQEFWNSMRDYLHYGVPACDQKGHWMEIRTRVRPIQIDLISHIKEKLPEGWFKNQGSLYRSIIAVGCKSIFKILELDKSEWNDILCQLNLMAKVQRKEEFRQESSLLKAKILNSSVPLKEKNEQINLICRLEEKFDRL